MPQQELTPEQMPDSAVDPHPNTPPHSLEELAGFEVTPEVTADYTNSAVLEALASLKAAPDYDRLAALFESLRGGYLFVDTTGAISKKKGARARTTRTTKGQLVLPIFTSMQALRAAHASGGRPTGEVKGILMPAIEALRTIESDRFVAIELNPGGDSLVVLRKYVALMLGAEPITGARLQGMQ